MNSPRFAALTLGLACTAGFSHSPPAFARGAGGHGGHSGGHIGGVHHGGAHVGGVHHGAYYGGGVYRSGIYGLGYGLGGYGYGINGIGIGGYGLGSSYYNYGYNSPGVIYSGNAPLLGSPNPGSTQVISLYPSADGSNAPSAAITTSRPVIQGNDGTGSIILRVPANAEVWWNGTRTVSGGMERLFGTLPLSADGAVHRFEAKWTDRNGQGVSQVREVRALPNQAVMLDFNAPLQTNPTPAVQPPINIEPSGVPNLPPVPDPFK